MTKQVKALATNLDYWSLTAGIHTQEGKTQLWKANPPRALHSVPTHPAPTPNV